MPSRNITILAGIDSTREYDGRTLLVRVSECRALQRGSGRDANVWCTCSPSMIRMSLPRFEADRDSRWGEAHNPGRRTTACWSAARALSASSCRRPYSPTTLSSPITARWTSTTKTPYVQLRCENEPAGPIKRADCFERYHCPNGRVPIGHRNDRAGLAAGHERTRRVCESRRRLYERMTERARRAYADRFAACGLDGRN